MNGQFDIGEITPLRYFAALAVLTGLLFGFIADGGSDDSSFLLQLLQWQLQSCIPMLLLVGSQLALARWRLFDRLNPWAQLALSGVTGAVLFTPIAVAIDLLLLGDVAGDGLTAELLDEFAGVAPPVIIFWFAINAPWMLGFRLQRGTDATPAESEAVPTQARVPAFMTLLDDERQGTLVYLEAELHYLAVVTTGGRSLLLYNLRDAIAELEDMPGRQTHRAYWVAAGAVTGFRRVGRQGAVQVSNGDEVPVSRRNVAEVADWCEQLLADG
jgi:hypothetical protein